MMLKRLGLIVISIFPLIFIFIRCDSRKTPSDVKGTVAWLEPESALPVFPFGTNPIYFIIHSDKSRPCRVMDEKIFTRPEIIEYMNDNITSIKIQPDSLDSVIFLGEQLSIKDFLDTLQVEGYPSHYFFTYKGELRGVRTGYIGLKEFKQLIKYIGEGYFEKYDFGTFLKKSASRLDTIWGEF